MNILITGSKGFIGKNLVEQLKNIKNKKVKSDLNIKEVFEINKDTSKEKFEYFCKNADFIFHLAGVNRPKNSNEFYIGNCEYTELLLKTLMKFDNKCPIVLSSSIQSGNDTEYGKTKLIAEKLLIDYSIKTKSKVFIYKLANVFGKWSKPNYNSVVSTFCYNISRDIDIIINDPNAKINLVYIDDVIKSFLLCINEKTSDNLVINRKIESSYVKTIKEIANRIYDYKNMRENLEIPDMKDEFDKKLYSTYLSYLDESSFKYSLKTNLDIRGSFTEFIHTMNNGQISINVTKPNITKGQHWHNTKNEKFLVVSGIASIKFRRIGSEKIIEYIVSEDKFEVLDIPCGYTHSITNIGKKDLVTIMWANEIFDKDNADTYFEEV